VSSMSWLSRHVFHPLWDIKDGSSRLRVLRELEKSQWLPEAQLRERQMKRLEAIVRHAGENCDFYRERFAQAGFDPARFDLARFHALPVLTKADIRSGTDRLIARGLDKSSLGFHKTGGSTGVSLTTYFDQDWLEVRTADALRADQWAGCYHGMLIASLWGNPPQALSLKHKLRNLLIDRFLYLDTMSLNDQSIGEFVTRWRREEPEIVFGHSHSIFMFARYLHEHGIGDLRPQGIISTSMMLIRQERALIEEVFQCKVTDRYGSEEVSLIGCECERHQGFHLNIEHLYIEFLKADGTHAAPGEEGTIVITDLLNRAMPLVRYRIEDVGVPSARTCECGRGLPLMDRVTGRVADYLKRRDGSLVAGVSLVERTLTAIPGFEQMQIVQPALDVIQLNIVRAPDFSPASEQQMLAEFGGVFGAGVDLQLNYVDRIPQERSGKYRFSICRV
jgi:phenylacetate-CoA ligase